VADDKVAELLHLALGVQVTRRIVRVTDHDGLGLIGYDLLELLDAGERETIIDCRSYGDDACTSGSGESLVIGVERLGDNNLVERIKAAHEGEKHGLGAATGDEHLVGRDIDADGLVVFGKLASVLGHACRIGILDDRNLGVLDCGERDLGREDVRLTDIEVVDMETARLSVVGIGDELADWGGRHDDAAL